MALAKDRIMPHDSCMGSVQEEACLESHSSPLCGPSSVINSNNAFVFKATNYQPEEEAHHHSLINFKSGYGNNNNFMHTCESLLSFEQSDQPQRASDQNSFLKTNHHKDEYSMWDQGTDFSDQSSKCSSHDQRLLAEFNCFQTASNYSSISNTTKKETQHGDGTYGWLYSEDPVVAADSIQESGTHETSFHKRPHMGESTQASKKHFTNANKKPKPKSSSSKDPQSVAAKNRRERISERLKVLQELVPNGSKVDLVTMLEKAISYVKFLQLQAKVLATDEFWPAQGGKAPDISQVKEAIDAILCSQRDTSSSSK